MLFDKGANSFTALYLLSFTFKNPPTWFWWLCEWMWNSWQQPFVCVQALCVSFYMGNWIWKLWPQNTTCFTLMSRYPQVLIYLSKSRQHAFNQPTFILKMWHADTTNSKITLFIVDLFVTLSMLTFTKQKLCKSYLYNYLCLCWSQEGRGLLNRQQPSYKVWRTSKMTGNGLQRKWRGEIGDTI